MAKKITLKNKNGDVLCPHTAIEQVQGLKEALDDKLGKTEKAVSAKATKVSKSSEADTNFALSFYAGQTEASTTPTADKVYVGSSVDGSIISVPKLDGSTSMANYMNLRMSFNSKFFHEIAVLPNNNDIYHRNVRNGNALEWKQLLEGLVTTSKIADTAITPAKIQTSIALNGTPSMTVEPTTSSPDKTIASVGLVKKAVENIEIGGTNLILNSDFSSGTEHWENVYWGTAISSDENILKVDIQQNANQFGVKASPVSLERGQQYIVSFDVRSESISSLNYSFLRSPSGNMILPNVIGITPEWQRFEIKFQPFISEIYNFSFGSQNLSTEISQSIEFRKVKLERGNKATDWSPAPEDVQTQIDAKLPLSGGTLTGDLIAPAFETTSYSGQPTRKTRLHSTGLNICGRENAGWAGGVAVVDNQASSLGTIAGAYGDSSYSPSYYFYGGAYNNSALKLLPDGRATFKNTVTAPTFDGMATSVKDGSISTSKIADTAITSAKLASSLILRGTPQLATQPTLSSESQNIASVGLVKEAVADLEIDTRNLIPNSTKIGRVSSSSDNYSFVTITLPTDVGVKIGDVFTFNCDKVENVHGNPTKYSIRLYNKKNRTVASKEQQITAENRVLPLEAWIDVEQGELALLVYMGEAGSTAGNEVYFYDCTLVKGNKPMLLWQPAPEDINTEISNAETRSKAHAEDYTNAEIDKIENGQTVAQKANSLYDADSNKYKNWGEIDTAITRKIGNKFEDYATKSYVQEQISNQVAVPIASETEYGKVELATPEDVTAVENDISAVNDSAKAVTPYTLKEYIASKNFATSGDISSAVTAAKTTIFFQVAQPAGGKDGDIWIKP